MENKIAVIIPAYKDTYLLNTLISINNQTDKKFNLYICNDSSPYNIEKVLADFKKINKIHFEYIKFENNLGGSDLIQHWNRCINQIKNEEWSRFHQDFHRQATACRHTGGRSGYVPGHQGISRADGYQGRL